MTDQKQLAGDIRNVLALLKKSKVQDVEGGNLLYISMSISRLLAFVEESMKEEKEGDSGNI